MRCSFSSVLSHRCIFIVFLIKKKRIVNNNKKVNKLTWEKDLHRFLFTRGIRQGSFWLEPARWFKVLHLFPQLEFLSLWKIESSKRNDLKNEDFERVYSIIWRWLIDKYSLFEQIKSPKIVNQLTMIQR